MCRSLFYFILFLDFAHFTLKLTYFTLNSLVYIFTSLYYFYLIPTIIYLVLHFFSTKQKALSHPGVYVHMYSLFVKVLY